MEIKHALLVTFAERYANVAMNFAVTAIAARLLTPEDFGLAAIGTSILGVIETVRFFGIGNYIVQHKALTREVGQTGFTAIAIVSLSIGIGLFAGAGHIAGFYRDMRLEPYIQVLAVAALSGIVSAPLLALLQRDMAFRTLAVINLSVTLVTAVVTVGLAVMGGGYMTYAWAGLAGSLTCSALALLFRPDYWIFRPAFTEWRSALAFGSYSSLTDTLSRAQDLLSYLILGRLLPIEAVGVFNRGGFVSQVPVKLLMTGIMPVALPGFAAEARAGRDLGKGYLTALSYMAAVIWPALAVLALLAHPAVVIVLGGQWLAAVPVVQLLALASFAAAPLPLNFPVLSAVGAIRGAAILCAVTLVLSVAVLLAAAPFGIYTIAASFFVTLPVQCTLSLWLIQRHIPFTLAHLMAAVRPAALLTLASAAVPAAAIVLRGGDFAIPVPLGIALGAAAVACWFAAAWAWRHPLFRDLASLFTQKRVEKDAAEGMDQKPSPAAGERRTFVNPDEKTRS